jgi:hypothetical protein
LLPIIFNAPSGNGMEFAIPPGVRLQVTYQQTLMDNPMLEMNVTAETPKPKCRSREVPPAGAFALRW